MDSRDTQEGKLADTEGEEERCLEDLQDFWSL